MGLCDKIKTNFYWLPTAIMIVSAILKFVQIKSILNFDEIPGIRDRLIYLGIIELISAIFYLFKPTMLIGFFILCTFLGGVIGMGIVMHYSNTLPLVILFLFGLSLYWRDPSLFNLYKNFNQN